MSSLFESPCLQWLTRFRFVNIILYGLAGVGIGVGVDIMVPVEWLVTSEDEISTYSESLFWDRAKTCFHNRSTFCVYSTGIYSSLFWLWMLPVDLHGRAR